MTVTASDSSSAQPLSFFGLWALYKDVLMRIRFRALACVFSTALFGLLEVIALVCLAPIIGHGTIQQNAGYLHGKGGLSHTIVHFLYTHSLRYAFLGFVAAGLASAFVHMATERAMVKTREGVERSMRALLTQKLFKTEWVYFLKLRQGDIGKSLFMEGLHIGQGCYALLQMGGQTLIVAIFLTASFFISPSLTLVACGFSALSSLGYFWGVRLASHHTTLLAKRSRHLGEQIEETFNNMKLIRATGKAQAVETEIESRYEAYAESAFYSEAFRSMIQLFYDGSGIVLLAIFLAFGLSRSHRSVEWVMVFLAIFYRLTPRIQSIQGQLYSARVHAPFLIDWKSKFAFASAHLEPNPGTQRYAPRDHVAFEHVDYRYPDRPEPALTDVSFTLRVGQCLAIAGESGGGKTTLIDLATGLLRPTRGRIIVDDKDLNEIDATYWRTGIGLVPQGSSLMFGTVLDNIAWGHADPDPERAEACARQVKAWEFINELPEKLYTRVEEKGFSLSGGQRQRLALARALYGKPWLLVLDEPTSELDNDSEEYVLESLRNLKGKVTILMVSHRARMMSLADDVLIMKKGRLSAGAGTI